MHTVCSVRRKFRKVAFFRVTGVTRPLPVRIPAVQLAGEVEARSWFSDEDSWLLESGKGDEWMTGYETDPMPERRRRIATRPLYERECTCVLAVGWCNCAV